MALIASWFFARRVVRPVRILREGVERIGTGDLGYRLDLKTGDEIEVFADEFNKMTTQLQESYANLEHKVEDRTRELDRIVGAANGDERSLEVISQFADRSTAGAWTLSLKVPRVCATQQSAQIYRVDGNVLRLAACHGSLPATEEIPIAPRARWSGRRGARPPNHSHPRPGSGVETEFPDAKEAQERFGHRTLTRHTVAARRQLPLGVIGIRRTEVRPFTDKQIALLKTFADQAVIAIENVRLFQEIQDKNEQLEAANRHKSQFLANVSHELRTPLNSIIGFTRIVLRRTDGQIPDLQKENLQKVLISSEHLLNLINELLDLSKIEAGRMEVYAETFHLNDVVRMATSTVEPMLKDGRVRLVTEIAPDIPPLKTDRDKLKQVDAQSFEQRRQVHREGRDQGGRVAGKRQREAHRFRHRHRHEKRSAGLHLRGVSPGGYVEHAEIRRHGFGSGDRQTIYQSHGRRDRRRERSRQRIEVHDHDTHQPENGSGEG